MTTTVSRRELTRWASEVSGGRISNLEKQCCTGAIYCQMIEAARPGVVDMRKVNLDADKNNALGNYKALQVALGKIGVESTSMDIQNLTNGQPQATMDLLQSLHQHLGGEGGGGAQTPRGLSNLDPNVENSGSRKRKAALPGGPAQIRKARTAKALEMEASLEVVAEDEGAAEAAEAARADSLESELLACSGRLRRSEEEACAAREETEKIAYLKNLMTKYLSSSEPSAKAHMERAVMMVLGYTAEEKSRILADRAASESWLPAWPAAAAPPAPA